MYSPCVFSHTYTLKETPFLPMGRCFSTRFFICPLFSCTTPHKPHTQILSYLVRQKSFPGGGRLGLRLRLRLSPSKGSPSSRTQRVSLPLQARSAHSSCSFTSPLDPLRSRVAPFTFLRTFYYT